MSVKCWIIVFINLILVTHLWKFMQKSDLEVSKLVVPLNNASCIKLEICELSGAQQEVGKKGK